MDNIKWCRNCVSMSTRPRITFDKKGICNACLWSKEKKKFNWKKNIIKLKKFLKKLSNSSKYNCIVPVSGGKDGSYVYHQVKNRFKLNPLAVTISPPLPQYIGKKNLENFVNSGASLITINPPNEAMRKLNFYGFKHLGFPYYGWLISIHTAVIRIANKFNIKLIFYGEDGELEYGGTKETAKKIFYNTDYQKKIYLENGYDKILKKSKISNKDSLFFTYPKKDYQDLRLTHYSYYENWNPYRNYLVAKKYYGLVESKETNVGTFSNFAQNDQKLYPLHTYIMYLKFGFGRTNQDAAIEIRRGAMKRQQAVELIKIYDNSYPEKYIVNYLDYFKISRKEFDKIIDKWVNKKLFFKKNNKWLPKFEIN